MAKGNRTSGKDRHNYKHGDGFDKNKVTEYIAWANMIQRCTNQNHPQYPHYGGRGITVCDEWLNDYAAFLRDVGRRPSPELTIDRIDNDKGYEPGNVRWANRSIQNANRRPFRQRSSVALSATVS